jgi:hypothetical protein
VYELENAELDSDSSEPHGPVPDPDEEPDESFRWSCCSCPGVWKEEGGLEPTRRGLDVEDAD